MKVKELIEKLQELDLESDVSCYAGYDRDYGAQWSYVTKVDIDGGTIYHWMKPNVKDCECQKEKSNG